MLIIKIMNRLTNINHNKFRKGPKFILIIYHWKTHASNRYNQTATNRYFEIDSYEDITLDLDVTDEVLICSLAYFV